MRPYLSFSSFDLFRRDPDKWYLKYVHGVEEPANDKMVIGKAFSEAYANPSYDYRKALMEARIAPSAAQMIARALENKALVRATPKNCEYKLELTVRGVPTLMYLDGAKPTKHLIIENKTGAPWTQERADEADQLTFYGAGWYEKTGKLPDYLLQSIDPKGCVRVFKTKRTVEQFDALWSQVDHVWREIQSIQSNH